MLRVIEATSQSLRLTCMILAPDRRSKMSKRDGRTPATTLEEFRDQGIPCARGAHHDLALLGWSHVIGRSSPPKQDRKRPLDLGECRQGGAPYSTREASRLHSRGSRLCRTPMRLAPRIEPFLARCGPARQCRRAAYVDRCGRQSQGTLPHARGDAEQQTAFYFRPPTELRFVRPAKLGTAEARISVCVLIKRNAVAGGVRPRRSLEGTLSRLAAEMDSARGHGPANTGNRNQGKTESPPDLQVSAPLLV